MYQRFAKQLILVDRVVPCIDNLSEPVARVVKVKPHVVGLKLVPCVPRASFTEMLPDMLSRGHDLINKLKQYIARASSCNSSPTMDVTGRVFIEVFLVEGQDIAAVDTSISVY